MREALLKKRYGIPAALLVLLIGVGVVVAATSVVVVNNNVTVWYPTHENLSIELGDIAAGTPSSGSASGFLGLPNATYDLTWTLSGDTGKFSSISIEVYVDWNKDTDYEDTGEFVGTLTKTTPQISKSFKGPKETTVRYDVSVTAADNEYVGVSVVSKEYDLVVNWDATRG